MAATAHFPKLKPLVKDMRMHHIDRDNYKVKYNNISFDIILSLDANPMTMLIGAINAEKPWCSVIPITKEYEMSMPDNDFYELRRLLHLDKNRKEKFYSYLFLNFIEDHTPQKCSCRPVPLYITRKYINTSDIDDERTVFCGWVDQSRCDRHARNFEKTRYYMGNSAAEFCIKNNISSKWITEEQARLKNIRAELTYPWAYLKLRTESKTQK